MQHYLLSIYQPAGGGAPSPEFLEPIMRDLAELNEEMREAGAWVFAGGLHEPGTATVLRAREGEVLMTDGPFTEGKEVLGGITVIRAADLDEALEWGRRLSRATTLPVEVRPFQGDA
ncbi:YciI family protein [Actinomadura sp. 9N407]|uniref:YciI family protein n=1 Tax=Actinomadura sp. 9N407 TaxID=3375154 RepID=UPI00379515E7